MRNKTLILIAILALAIGFATVSTVLYINGTTTIGANNESFDHGVIFKTASTDDGGSAIIEQDGKSITFSSNVLVQKDDSTILNYTIANLDKNYDATAEISCKFLDEDKNEVNTNPLIDLALNPTTFNIVSGGTVNGSLTATLIHNAEVATNIEIKCTVIATAIERTSAGSVTKANTNVLQGIFTDENRDPITSGYLAVFSDEMKVVEIGTNGEINVTGLEDGINEIYYMGSTNPTGKKKAEVKTLAVTSGEFATTMTSTTIELNKESNKNYILNAVTGTPVEITFNAGDGTLVNNTKYISPRGSYGELPEPEYDGHQFIGWYKENTYETEVTSGSMYSVVNANTLYAKYIVNKYNVTLTNNNKVTLNTNNVEIEYGKNGQVIATPLEGYYLSSVTCNNGYITNATTGESSTNEQTITISNNNKATNATCNFEATAKEYDVTISITNGTSNVSTLKVAYGGTNTVTITPKGYIESITCTNGYTTNAIVGETSTSAQIITISNNENNNGSVCTVNVVKTTLFEIGDYVSMTPDSSSYTISTSLTGYSSNQTINPSELNLWRVIRINSDKTVEMVSEYVSSTAVYIGTSSNNTTGFTDAQVLAYKNYIGTLNTIASQYGKSGYTVATRHMGYSNQTETITDTSMIKSSTAPWSSSTGSSTVESQGGGDTGYTTDTNLVRTACGSLIANKVGTTQATSYWLASRNYRYDNDDCYFYYGRAVYSSGYISGNYLHNRVSSKYYGGSGSYVIRPIVTLGSTIKIASGAGTSSSPYTLTK